MQVTHGYLSLPAGTYLNNKLKIFWTNFKLHGTFVLCVSSPFSVSSGDFSEFSAWSCGVVMSATICSATWNHVKRKAMVAQANRGPFVWRWKWEYMGNNTLRWQFYHRWSRHWGMQQCEFNIFSNNQSGTGRCPFYVFHGGKMSVIQ